MRHKRRYNTACT